MSAILNSLNVHNSPIFQPILIKLVSKFIVYRALTDKTYLLSELLSPLTHNIAKAVDGSHFLVLMTNRQLIRIHHATDNRTCYMYPLS